MPCYEVTIERSRVATFVVECADEGTRSRAAPLLSDHDLPRGDERLPGTVTVVNEGPADPPHPTLDRGPTRPSPLRQRPLRDHRSLLPGSGRSTGFHGVGDWTDPFPNLHKSIRRPTGQHEDDVEAGNDALLRFDEGLDGTRIKTITLGNHDE